MKQWIKIRRELYEQVRRNVEGLLGEDTKGFATYQRAYESEFSGRWVQASRDQLLAAVTQSRLVGFADFHALQQSQKAHLRIMRSLPKTTKKILAVEFFEARHQATLDSYQQGRISESDFLKKIEWQKSWGFAWEHYRPLVRWAVKNGVKICGLDQRMKNRTASALKERDRFSGKKIAELLETHPEHQVLVVFGDMHWAAKHLPAQIQKHIKLKKGQMTWVLQNSEKIYFQLLQKEMEMTVEIVRRGQERFCLMSVPPWVKWQNYLLYLEEKYDRELDQDAVDYADHVSKYVQLISKDLGLEVKADHFSVYSAESSAFWSEFSDGLKPEELKWYRSLVENSVSFYIPRTHTAYLAQISVNHAAQLAMAIVYAQVSQAKAFPSQMPDDFLKLIWFESLLYFGSKIVNPKRKTDTLIDMKARLAVSIPGDQGLEAMKLALSQKMSELVFISSGKSSRVTARVRRKVSYREAARLLGGMLGERLYFAYRKKLLSQYSIQQILKKSLESENFRDVYYELIEMLENYPDPFVSKKEKV